MNITAMYAHHEKLKKKAYNDRILKIEKETFTPLVFSCSDGASVEASKFIKKLLAKLNVKRQESYALTVNFIRRRIRFYTLASASYRSEESGVAEIDWTEMRGSCRSLNMDFND